jgi:glycosyltransferase involved in cell wall biosynthesis
MRSLADGLRKLRARVGHHHGGFRGYVDGVMGGEIVGWVQPVTAGQQMLRVGVFVQGARIHEVAANVHRRDLEKAGVGDGRHGFVIPVTPEMTRIALANSGRVDLRVLSGDRSIFLEQVQIVEAAPGAEVAPLRGSALRKRLYGGLELLAERLSPERLRTMPLPAPRPAPACSTAQARLFAPRDYMAPGRDGPLPAPLFAYADYMRYRYRVDAQFDPAARPGDMAHFLKFYLGSYAPMRRSLRVPMSAETIAWLNAPQVIGGQPRHLSRAAWSFMMEVQPILHSIDFHNPDWYAWAAFWWAVNHSEAVGGEDCLVPDYMAAALSHVPERFAGQTWAPSEFMVRMHAETAELSELPLEEEDGRRRLACALLIMALFRPDFLRYLPRDTLEAALAPRQGILPPPEAQLATLVRGPLRLLRGPQPPEPDPTPTALAEFCAELDRPMPGLTRAAYAGVLRQQGFELDGLRFATLTAEGHRLEAARLPVPGGSPVDIQIIGPVKKASGLGQATRLSAACLEATLGRELGLTINTVDYSLDNPAPEGFSSERDAGDYRPARVNLFHINAESLPLSVAYQPEVMEGAYNIGYVFWELDSPAACHHLGLDLMDEIWVSTQYGVDIYRPHTDRPVVNVGMSYEALPEITRTGARAFLKKKTGVPDDAFVFAVTFDSFSFVQRKNPLGVLQAFAQAFPVGGPPASGSEAAGKNHASSSEAVGNNSVRLVIKTQNRAKVTCPVQMAIWEQVDAALAADRRISLVDETLRYEDLLKFKKGADAYISLHRSEGWGFGMIEAMNLGVPVLATGYSGNMDFCDDRTCWLVDYRLVELTQDDYIFVVPGQKWAEPDVAHAARQMRAMRDDPRELARRARAARAWVQQDFSEVAIGHRYAARMREILAELDGGARCRVAE